MVVLVFVELKGFLIGLFYFPSYPPKRVSWLTYGTVPFIYYFKGYVNKKTILFFLSYANLFICYLPSMFYRKQILVEEGHL